MEFRTFSSWRARLGRTALLAGLGVAAVFGPAPGGARDSAGADSQPQSGSYLAGRFAQHVDDWKAAAQYLGEALARDPDDAGLLRRTFILELGDGRLDDALPLAKRLIQAEAGSPLAVLLLVADDVNGGRLDDAATRLATLTPEGVAKYAGPLLGGWLAQARGQPRAAVEAALAPLASTQGLSILHALHMAMIADVAGDTETAAKWYDEALRGNPATLRVVQAVGSFLVRTGHADKARALYGVFARDNAEGGLIDPAALIEEADLGTAPALGSARDGMAEGLFDLASALHQEGSDELAMVYARLALYLRPQFPLTQLLVGDILTNNGHIEEALALYREVARDHALGWTARLRVAESLIRLERYDEAAAEFETLAGLHPDRADPLVRLGDLLRANKKYPEAVKAYDRALDRIPHPEERHWTVFYGRAACYERTGPWEKAEKDLLAALDLSRDQAILLNFLGYSWVDKGVNLVRAKTMIERAVALRPKDGYIIDSLGWALFRMGDTGGAVTQLERAIELKPLDPTINDHLGDAYWAVGRQGEAVFQWRRALQNSDEADLTESVTRKLKERDAAFASHGAL